MPDAIELLDASASYTPLRFGLLSAAQQPDPTTRWRMGLEREQPECVEAVSLQGLPCTTGATTPAITGSSPWAQSDPFVIAAWTPCSPVGYGDNLEDLRTATDSALTNGEGRALERLVWTGATSTGVAVYPHLAEDTAVTGSPWNAGTGAGNRPQRQSAATTVTSAAVDVVEAVGLLEAYLAECYGGEGVIHVPRQALAHLGAYNLVDREGQQLRTLGGNIVAAYSAPRQSLSPAGAAAAAGEAWFYATGTAYVWRSPIQHNAAATSEFLNVAGARNDTYYVAYRTYAMSWDCCHLAAQVSLGGIVGGGIGGAT